MRCVVALVVMQLLIGGVAADDTAKSGPTAAVPAVVARFAERLRATPPADRPADRLNLFIMDVETGASTPVAATDPTRAYRGSPAWSADGRRIYYDASPGFGKWADTRVQCLELTAVGVSRRDLVAGNCPSPSPDGKRVAYLLNAGVLPGAASGVYVTDGAAEATGRLGGFGIPKWSPDGKHLLVVPFANPCEPTLMDAVTGHERPVRLAGHRIYSVPSWAGGGALVAVVRSATGFSVSLVDVTAPAEATVKETLWRRGNGLRYEVEPLYPVYSPEQKRGVFVGREPKDQALYTFQPGQTPRRLELGQLDPKVASLSLSPDGRYVLFCADRPVVK